MPTPKSRIDLLEMEVRFRRWIWHQRLLESLSIEQLQEYAFLGQLPEALPVPFRKGASELDGMSRTRLIELWKENERYFAGRTEQEMIYFRFHGHWPEQACTEQDCSKAESDQVISQHQARQASKAE